MRSVSRILALVLVGFLLSLSLRAADDKGKKDEPAKKTTGKKTDAKKDKDSDKDKDKDKPKEKWLKFGEVIGKVQGVVESKKSLRIQLTIGKDKKDVEWVAIDDVKVRMRNPPPKFDDKGRFKRYTKKELKELKGDDKLPGYPAEFSDLKTDQYVRVTLVKKKGGPRPGVKRGKDADADPSGEYLPKMSMIMIEIQPRN